MAFIYDLTDTWNAGGTTFNAIKMNVTDTASAAASKLITVQVSGSEKFSVKKDGVGYFAGNVGIGTSSPSAVGSRTTLNVSGSAGSAIRLSDDTANAFIDYTDGSGARFSVNAAEPLLLQTNSLERMRIDSSGNVGIGTSSPSAKLDISAGTNLNIGFRQLSLANYTNEGIGFTLSRTTSDADLMAIGVADADKLGMFSREGMVFATGGGVSYSETTERMRIDSSGNVGIGTSSPDKHLHISDTRDATIRLESLATSIAANDVIGAIEWEGNDATTGSNGVVGKIDYIAEDATPEYAMRFFTHDNLAGVADFAERLRITSAGNVGIGTSSPDAKLHVSGDTFFVNTVAGRGFQLKTIASSNGRSDNAVQYSAGDASSAEHTWGYGGAASFTERMRIDSSGNVGIGTSSPSNPLDIEASTATVDINMTNTANRAEINLQENGTTKGILQYRGSTNGTLPSTMRIGTQGSDDLIFNTAGAERLRVLGNGDVGIGCTSSQENVTSGASGHFIRPTSYPSFASDGAIALLLNRTGSDGQIAQFRKAGSTVGFISVTTSATTYNTASDYRLKDIDGPVANSGAYIDALKPVQGSWKADGSRFIGLLAHEVQEVSETQIATGEKDGEEMQAMDYSSPELIANLIAEIQSLRARVAQLEG